MSLFGGLFDFSKEGPGVSKDAPKKKRFFLFFDVYFRKFWKLCLLNLIYVLFCLPMVATVILGLPVISGDPSAPSWMLPAAVLSFVLTVITFGPATAGVTYVLRNFSREEHAYVWYHFWKAFRSNFRQAAIMGTLEFVIAALAAFVMVFYITNIGVNSYFVILLIVSIVFVILFMVMNYYIWLLMVTVNLRIPHIIKNSLIFSVIGIKYNFVTFVFTLIVSALEILFLPLTVPIVVVFGMVTPMFISTFGVYPVVKKYCIDPVLAAQEEEEDAEEESVFNDELLIGDSAQDDDEE